MKYFDTYVSACTAGAGNQSFFTTGDENETHVSRSFFKPTFGGKGGYSFLFSNVVDSTYSDGSHGRCNRIVGEWHIESASVCVCTDFDGGIFVPLTFDGERYKTVHPGEFFASDEVTLSPEKGEYICIELAFRGRELPYHPETLVPVFVKNGGKFEESKFSPLPSMIGKADTPKCRAAFWGDSITQGIGTTPDKYRNYASIAAETLGSGFACWNLGIGYGRASDAASDGAWAYKAKQNDIVTVCFGVNDIYQTGDSPIKELEKTVSLLKKSGVKVVIQTVPPFDYDEAHKKIWEETNDYIKTVLRHEADGFLDVTEFLSESDSHPEKAKFGGHPNDEGNAIWGSRLAEVIKYVTE